MRRVLVLGSTGSIGMQALEVIAAHPDRFELVGLAAEATAKSSQRRRPRPG
jgi:1-deoxy-D-xylulose-5-phosphate reductoisomerase